MERVFTPETARWQDILSGDAVRLRPGVYRMTEPAHLTGLRDVSIQGEGATLSGAAAAHVEFEAMGGDIYAARLRCERCPDGLVVDGRRFRMARYPHFDPAVRPLGGFAGDCLEFAARCERPEGAYLHALHSHMWGSMHYRVTGRDGQGGLVLEGGWQNNRPMGRHDTYMYIENLREALGADGEFFYDVREGRLYLCSTVRPSGDIELVYATCLLSARDCHGLSLEGLRFCDTARTFMAEYEPLGRSDWCIHRSGALLIEECGQVNISGCEFEHLGGNAAFMSGGVSGVRVERCSFHDVGASCACFVGRPECLRYGYTNYGDAETAVDEVAVGPAGTGCARDCEVRDCLMHDFGTVEKQCAGVEISMAARIAVRDCTIYDCPRAAINVGENSFGGHVIEGCDIFDTVLETGDHGSFNSWGRDRYWNREFASGAQRRELALKDACEPVVIRGNRLRCDHGWDIDLDDGSSNYVIESNLCLNGGIKLREGVLRVCRNNITVNNTVHVHVWYEDSGDVIERNLVFKPYEPIGMKGRWGERVDGNLLRGMNSEPVHAAELSELSGQDGASLKLRIDFADPERGDFTLPYEVCALTGFTQLPREYGVRDGALRAQARSCPLPVVVSPAHSENVRTVDVEGVRLKSIETDGEMSAFATAGHVGAIVIDIAPHHRWFAEGLRAGRAIIEVDGRPLASAEEFARRVDAPARGLMRLTLKGNAGEIEYVTISVGRDLDGGQ